MVARSVNGRLLPRRCTRCSSIGSSQASLISAIMKEEPAPIINRLREQERTRLGNKFDLREFHDKLLSAGSISLPLVEKRHFAQ